MLWDMTLRSRSRRQDNAEAAGKQAAWLAFVEISTRSTAVPLRSDEGILREVVADLYELFGQLRTIVRDAGPEISPDGREPGSTAADVIMTVLAQLREFLSAWHPRLEGWHQSADGAAAGAGAAQSSASRPGRSTVTAVRRWLA